MSPIPSNDAQSNDAGSLANSVFDTSSTRPPAPTTPATHLNPSIHPDQSQQQDLPSRSGASKVYYADERPPAGSVDALIFPNVRIRKLGAVSLMIFYGC
jgi:hypothetical protein